MMASKPGTTGADLLVGALVQQEVKHLFNNPGNGSWTLIDALVGTPIEYVMALHEGSLVSIADGFARASGRPQVSNLYMVPGTANAMSPMYIARHDRSPLVVTAVQQRRSVVGREGYGSNDDLLNMARSVSKWAHEVNSPERLPEAVHRAFTIAMTPPRGPAFLSLPFDLFGEEVGGDVSLVQPARPSAIPRLGGLGAEACDRLVAELASAERPALVAGREVVDHDATAQLERLAELIGAPIFHEEWTMASALPGSHPLLLGTSTTSGELGVLGRFGPDFLLHVGARIFPEHGGPSSPELPAEMKVAAIGERAFDMGRSRALVSASLADVRVALEELIAAYPAEAVDEKTSRRLELVATVRDEQRRSKQAGSGSEPPGRPPTGTRIFQEIKKVLTPETLVVEQATTATYAFRAEVDNLDPRNLFSTSSSNQGWGLPAAVGVQMARPGQPVLGIVGDGGFSYTPQALWTAARYGAPLAVVVLNNSGYGVMRGNEEVMFPRAMKAGTRFDFNFDADVVGIAKGYGAAAIRVTDARDVADAVEAALKADRVTVVEITMNDGTA